jgi:preprotein translocase subunit SecY
LCIIQSTFYLGFFQTQNLVYPSFHGTATYWIAGVMAMTTGTMFLMWLGEQIDKYGIGNGASMIICAGIISRMPAAIGWVYGNFSVTAGDPTRTMNPMKVLMLLAAFLIVISGTILITQGQRRITVQQAKHTRGRKVYGGQRSYLPLRVNHGGVMPIIFASSLLMFPTMILPWFANTFNNVPVMGSIFHFLKDEFGMTGGYRFIYLLAEVSLIYFFAYFWTSVQFQPNEMADQLRDHGSFIPGLRPGPRTAEYLERVMERITYVGAGFLAAIAVIPTIVTNAFQIPFQVSSFLGGTGLLITVSVALDLIQRVEANLLMRNYKGFLGGGGPDGGGKGPRIRGSRTS